jgi:hypothetical protein
MRAVRSVAVEAVIGASKETRPHRPSFLARLLALLRGLRRPTASSRARMGGAGSLRADRDAPRS